MELIFKYRPASLTDDRNTYPAKSMPTVPSKFRTTLIAVMTFSLNMPFWHFTFDAVGGATVGLQSRSFCCTILGSLSQSDSVPLESPSGDAKSVIK